MNLDKTICAICGHAAHFIPPSHLRKHNITTAEYKIKYPDSSLVSPSFKAAAAERGRLSNEKRKGIPRTDELKAKVAATKKARYAAGETVAWNKGIPRTKEQNQHMSVLVKQQYVDGRIPPMLGKHHPDHLKKMWSELYTGRTLSPETLAKQAQAFATRTENGWIHHNVEHISLEARGLLGDSNWLLHQHRILKRPLNEIAVELGVDPSTVHNRFKEFNLGTPQRFAISKNERELVEYITTLNIDIVSNTRKIITPLELDLYLPTHHLAIEHCGIYWHSSRHKAADYHLHKLNKCMTKGVQLLTLFEDEWTFARSVVEQTIQRMLGNLPSVEITTRDLIVDVDASRASQFVTNNHLDNVPCDKTIGVQHNGVLHTVIDYTAQGTVITLNKVVHSVVQPISITPVLQLLQQLYPSCTTINWIANSRWDIGKACAQNGFTLSHNTPPEFYWVKGLTRHDSKIFTPPATDNTPQSLTKTRGQPTWYQLYDCGRQVWSLQIVR